MAILINDNYSLQATNKAFDARYLDINVPWANCAAAIAGIPTYRYPGLTININNEEWWWKDGITDGDLTQKSLGGTSDITGATNGLSLSCGGTYVGLGGSLTGNTTINLAGSSLIFSGSSASYFTDYSSSYNLRSIPDVGYVTGYTQSAVTNVSNTVDVCNVYATYTATTANDFIGVSGASLVYLPAVPKPCQRISIADICGNALGDSIIVCGCWGSNGQNINGDTFSTINTDYGSMTFINNGVSWSAVAFIN